MKLLKYLNFEAVIWISGLTLLYFLGNVSNHFTICPFNYLGITFCPGCGLGKSISELLHFNFTESFHTHPLGLFALIVLFFRIYILERNQLRILKHTN